MPLPSNEETPPEDSAPDSVRSISTTGWTPQNMLPEMDKFSGAKQGLEEGESIDMWLEGFESLATAYGWDDRMKPLQLISRLKGPALVFVRSFRPEQRKSFTVMREALSKRFTPVHIESVQGSVFHRRSQRVGESVDDFAQQMVQLYGRAYPYFVQNDIEHGKRVLVNAFVAGLLPYLHTRLAGASGTFDELLLRARFEEAKRNEVPSEKSRNDYPPPVRLPAKTVQRGPQVEQTVERSERRCFNCSVP